MQIAIVGFGFMGRMHFANWSRCEGVDIVAICEQNPNVLQNLNNPIGNIEGLPVAIDLSRVNLYSDLSEMLAAERLDAVSITLPTHLHADCSIRAPPGRRPCPVRKTDGPDHRPVRQYDRSRPAQRQTLDDRPLHSLLARICQGQRTDRQRTLRTRPGRLISPPDRRADLEQRQLADR